MRRLDRVIYSASLVAVMTYVAVLAHMPVPGVHETPKQRIETTYEKSAEQCSHFYAGDEGCILRQFDSNYHWDVLKDVSGFAGPLGVPGPTLSPDAATVAPKPLGKSVLVRCPPGSDDRCIATDGIECPANATCDAYGTSGAIGTDGPESLVGSH